MTVQHINLSSLLKRFLFSEQVNKKPKIKFFLQKVYYFERIINSPKLQIFGNSSNVAADFYTKYFCYKIR